MAEAEEDEDKYDVMRQVDVLFKKLNALPAKLKDAAVKKIESRLHPREPPQPTSDPLAVSPVKRRQQRPRVKVEAEEGNEGEAVVSVEEIVTRRGRRAKRIKYTAASDAGDNIKDNPGAKESRGVKKPKAKSRPRKQYTDKELTCQYCNYRCTHKAQVVIHERRHTGETPYECPECGKKFNQSSGLTVHLKRHRGQRDFACEFCSYRSFTKIDLYRHSSIHTGERNHVCQHCGKAFAKDSTLREHVKSVHERTKKFSCEQCNFVTYRSSNLNIHVRIRHKGEYNNHVCPVCQARLKHRQAFLDHMRRHTGERPFQCDECEANFATRSRLNVHQRSVHQPRGFPCPECNKAFQTKHHLERHALVHTDARPYSCPFCPYACNTQGNVTKHIRTVHDKWDFSYRAFVRKSSDQGQEIDPLWLEKGRQATGDYLRQLSKKLGKEVTLAELEEHEREKKRKAQEEAAAAKVRRLSRNKGSEHCYHIVGDAPADTGSQNTQGTSEVQPSSSVVQAGESAPLPTTSILQPITVQTNNSIAQPSRSVLQRTGTQAEQNIAQLSHPAVTKTSSTITHCSSILLKPSAITCLQGTNVVAPEMIGHPDEPGTNTTIVHVQSVDLPQQTDSLVVQDVPLTLEVQPSPSASPQPVHQLVHIQTAEGEVQEVSAFLLGDVLHLPSGETVPVLRTDAVPTSDKLDYLQSEESLDQMSAGIMEDLSDTVVVIINTEEDQGV